MIDWHDIEDRGYEAEQLAILATTIEDAINYGPSDAKVYLGSLSLLGKLLSEHARKLNTIAQAEIRLTAVKAPKRAEATQ